MGIGNAYTPRSSRAAQGEGLELRFAMRFFCLGHQKIKKEFFLQRTKNSVVPPLFRSKLRHSIGASLRLPVTGAAVPPYLISGGRAPKRLQDILPPLHQMGRSLKNPYSSFSPLLFGNISLQLMIAYRINAKMTSPNAIYNRYK